MISFYRLIFILSLLIFFPGLQSCALIFSGTKDKVSIANGAPAGAKVYVGGTLAGNAPCRVNVHKTALKPTAPAQLSIQADGYTPQEIQLPRKVKVGAVIGDLLFTGGLGLIPDFLTGAIYKSGTQNVQYSLAPIAGYNGNTLGLAVGDAIIFSSEKYKNQAGIIVALYPDRALVKFTPPASPLSKLKTDAPAPKEEQMEVPFSTIARQ